MCLLLNIYKNDLFCFKTVNIHRENVGKFNRRISIFSFSGKKLACYDYSGWAKKNAHKNAHKKARIQNF